MQITIQSFWKHQGNSHYSTFYLETTIGKIYSPLQFLFRNFYTGSTISEEKLLATLASYDLESYNKQLYSILVERVSKKSPQYIVDELLRFCEAKDGIKNLYKEDAIYNVIKNDKVCKYIYFDEYYFREYDYQLLNKIENLEEKTFYNAVSNIKYTKQVDRYNYIGLSYFRNINFLINYLDKYKLTDENVKNYLIPNLPLELKENHTLWLYLIDLPSCFLSITDEKFRIEHYEEYKRKNKKKTSQIMLYLSLSKENQEKYSYLFTDLKLTPQILSKINKENSPTKKNISNKSSVTQNINSSITQSPLLCTNNNHNNHKQTEVFKNKINYQQENKNYHEYKEIISKNKSILKSIYQKYYPKYLEQLSLLFEDKNISKIEFYQKKEFSFFLSTLLLNNQNFNIIYKDKEIDFKTFCLLVKILFLLEPNTKPKLELYMLNQRKKELKKYIEFIIKKINKENNVRYLEKNEVLKYEFIDFIIKSKSLFQKEKAIILKSLLEEETLTIQEITYLLEELNFTKITINEILQEHKISKTIFYKLYQDFLIEDYTLLKLTPNYVNINNSKKLKKKPLFFE